MSKCGVPGCKTKKRDKITFFNVPVNVIMRRAWEKRIGVTNLKENALLCAKHFKLKDVGSTKNGVPKLRISALPQLGDGNEITTSQKPPSAPPPLPTIPYPEQYIEKSKRKAKVTKYVLPMIIPKTEIPDDEYLAQCPIPVNPPNMEQQQPTLQPPPTKPKRSRKKQVRLKQKTMTILDPLDIKNEIMDTDDAGPARIPAQFNDDVSFVDSFNLSQDNAQQDIKPMDRLAHLEAENVQLKTKYSQLINDYVQMKTEKIQLKAELDAALAANQKLIIVKNSLVTTIQTMGKMSDAPTKLNGLQNVIQSQLDAIADVPDTIIGF